MLCLQMKASSCMSTLGTNAPADIRTQPPKNCMDNHCSSFLFTWSALFQDSEIFFCSHGAFTSESYVYYPIRLLPSIVIFYKFAVSLIALFAVEIYEFKNEYSEDNGQKTIFAFCHMLQSVCAVQFVIGKTHRIAFVFSIIVIAVLLRIAEALSLQQA